MRAKKRKIAGLDERGFTLMESLLSLVIVGIISLAFASVFLLALDGFSRIASRKETLANARYGVNRIAAELIAVQPSQILAISPTLFRFVDQGGNVTDFHSQSESGVVHLYRGADLLARNLTSFSLSYYDAAGNLLTDYSDPSALRRVRIDMTVKDMSGLRDMSVRGEVFPRNFYYSGFQ